jgi:hypothetical protein
MPVRMSDDPNEPQDQNDDNRGGRGGGGGGNFPGGGGGLVSFLPLLLTLFRSKKGLILLAVLVGGYFLLNRSGACNIRQLPGLATGGMLSKQEFEKASIYEPLTEDNSKNPLPEAANLQKFAPVVGQQGHQGSCVAWSSVYAARSILESARTGQPGENVKFSPSFVYNQIGLEGCQGSYILRAMEFMTQKGAVAYNKFPYNEQDCSQQPGNNLMQDAQQYKMRGFVRLTKGDRNDVIDRRAIKENLAQGAPVVIGMMVGQSFMQNMLGKEVWNPEPGDEQQMGFGGHAMCVVGYDDRKYGGAFLIMNSWGPEWGTNGFGWVRYAHFDTYVREAYGLQPMQKVGTAANTPFECEIGLMQVVQEGNKRITKNYIPLRTAGDHKFETIQPQKKGDLFKIEIKNTTECYIYVFGKETNGNSYTLFPYPNPAAPTKTKYAPFCGITGVRLFPSNQSMQLDSVGNRDVIAVVVSKQPLDWYQLNQQITQNPQTDYAIRVNTALASQLIKNVSFKTSSKGTMQFVANGNENQVVASVVEIDKN